MKRLLGGVLLVAALISAAGMAVAAADEEARRHWLLALQYVKMGMPNRAMDEAKVVVKLDPNHQQAKDLIAAKGRPGSQEIEGAAPLSATEMGSQNAVFLAREARRAYREDRADVARRTATGALQTDPGNAEAKQLLSDLDDEVFIPSELDSGSALKESFEKGIGLYRRESWDEALVAFQDAMAISPMHEQSAKFYRKTLDKARAIRVSSLIGSAKEDIKAGKTEDAKAKLKEAQGLAPTNEEIGPLLKSVGGDTETEERLKKSNDLYLKGKAQYESQDYRKAIETLADAVRTNSANKEAVDLLAKAKAIEKTSMREKRARIGTMHDDALKAFQMGDYEKSYQLYKEILNLDPKDERAMQNMKIIEPKLGKQ
jgi:tetratricopeptide (TPR) repeat protein